MTIIEALVKLRNDLKLWVTNNLRVKMDKNLGEEEANKVLITDENGDVVTSDNILASSGITATATELNYCGGVTSNIQTQIDDLWEHDEFILDGLSENIGLIQTNLQGQIDAKQDLLSLKVSNFQDATISTTTVGTITSLILPTGRWLIFGRATFPSQTNTEGATHQYKICLSDSTSFNSSTEVCGTNLSNDRSWSMNTFAQFDITNDDTPIYLLGYHDATTNRNVTNGRICAIKVGNLTGAGSDGIGSN